LQKKESRLALIAAVGERYRLLFSTAANPSGAKNCGSNRGSPKILLGYDSGDYWNRRGGTAHRKCAGIRDCSRGCGRNVSTVKVDARLVRIRMTSSHAREALASSLQSWVLWPGSMPARFPARRLGAIYERERSIVKHVSRGADCLAAAGLRFERARPGLEAARSGRELAAGGRMAGWAAEPSGRK